MRQPTFYFNMQPAYISTMWDPNTHSRQPPEAELFSRLLIKMTTGGSAKSGLVLGGWLLSIGSSSFFSIILFHSSYLVQILDKIPCLEVHFPHSTEKSSCSTEWNLF